MDPLASVLRHQVHLRWCAAHLSCLLPEVARRVDCWPCMVCQQVVCMYCLCMLTRCCLAGCPCQVPLGPGGHPLKALWPGGQLGNACQHAGEPLQQCMHTGMPLYSSMRGQAHHRHGCACCDLVRAAAAPAPPHHPMAHTESLTKQPGTAPCVCLLRHCITVPAADTDADGGVLIKTSCRVICCAFQVAYNWALASYHQHGRKHHETKAALAAAKEADPDAWVPKLMAGLAYPSLSLAPESAPGGFVEAMVGQALCGRVAVHLAGPTWHHILLPHMHRYAWAYGLCIEEDVAPSSSLP